MVTKRSKLMYEFTNVIVSQRIDINFSTLEMDDGNTFNSRAAAYYVEVIASTVNATISGSMIAVAGLGVGGSSDQSRTMVIGGIEAAVSSNVVIFLTAPSDDILRIDLDLGFLTLQI